jgi:hypothetical protein
VASTAPSPETKAKPKSRMKIAAISVIIIVIVIGAFLAYWLFLRPRTTSWLFKGAYATYKGTTTLLSYMTMNITIRQEVVDYNSTHAKLLTFTKMETSFAGATEYQNTI